MENRIEDVGVTSSENKKQKVVHVIRKSIFTIFVFFSVLVMLVSLITLVFGLCYTRLLYIIDEGARPPALLNIAIMAEAGATISLDAMAQAHNDLLIVKGFTEIIIQGYMNEPEKHCNQASFRRLEKDGEEAQATDENTSVPLETSSESV